MKSAIVIAKLEICRGINKGYIYVTQFTATQKVKRLAIILYFLALVLLFCVPIIGG